MTTPEVVRQIPDVPAVTQFLDRVDDVPVSRQRQTPMIQRVQKTVEVPQVQFIDKFVDAPVSVQADLEIELEVSTPEHTPPAADPSWAVTRTHDDENQCVIASTEEMEQDACVHAVAPASSRAQREFDKTEAGMECVREDLKETKKMLEFLVRTESRRQNRSGGEETRKAGERTRRAGRQRT